jgi:rhodanese-related sulfurtransferase
MNRGPLIIITLLCLVLASQAAAQAPGKISAQDLQQLIEKKGAAVINIMSILECRDHMIPGSICIPCRELAQQAPEALRDRPERIAVYGDRAGDAAGCPAVQQALAGRNVSLLDGGLEAWKKAGFGTVSLDHISRLPVPAMQPQALMRAMAAENLLVVDIRPEQAFAAGHIEGAINMPLDLLHIRYNELPNDRRIIVADEDGSRSLFAASYLERKGFRGTGRLSGGMKKWRASSVMEKQ